MERKVDKIIVIRAVGRMVFEKNRLGLNPLTRYLNERVQGLFTYVTCHSISPDEHKRKDVLVPIILCGMQWVVVQ